MPTELGQPYPLTWRGNPPHLLKEDIPTWWRYVEKQDQDWTTFYYDVRLGGPLPTDLPLEQKWGVMWYRLKAFRVDVVAEARDFIWLIEVTSSANLRSLGQVVAYKYLWARDPVIKKTAVPVLLCTHIDADIAYCLQQFGAKLVVV